MTDPGPPPQEQPRSGHARPSNPVTTPREPREGYTAVGRVLRPHALRGELRVKAFSASAANLQPGRPVYLGGVRRAVLRAREDREAWILQLEGVNDRTAAERYRGELLEAPDDEVLRDDADSFFVHELIGLRVETVAGVPLGELVDVMQPGANDVYVVRRADGEEFMIPAIGEVIDDIDIRGRVMRITPLPGLLDESQ